MTWLESTEPLEPIAPGQADPDPVGTNVADAEQFARSIAGRPAPAPGALPPLNGVPHCTRCWGYHHRHEVCHARD